MHGVEELPDTRHVDVRTAGTGTVGTASAAGRAMPYFQARCVRLTEGEEGRPVAVRLVSGPTHRNRASAPRRPPRVMRAATSVANGLVGRAET